LITSLLIIAFLMIVGIYVHHGLSTGIVNDRESLYNKTIVSKAYSSVLPTLGRRDVCPKTKRHCYYNDHLGCKHFQTLDNNRVVCDYSKCGSKSAKSGDQTKHNDNRVSTEIDKVAFLIQKHKKVVFDQKLTRHLDIKPQRLYNHLKCLERYKFIKQSMDPVHGLTIEWVDDTDLLTNGYSKDYIKRELNNRRYMGSPLA